ncbi:MAG: molecular chaperone DnaK, partial [Candidatus Competibacteraceae bacterium]|nr:molecular chaperone DnaK [Candidatus Competibacteraceae bacterium]
LLEQYFGERSSRVDPKGIKTLRNDLEKLLGKRDAWDSALLRGLFAVLLDGARRRRRSADHERLWLNLTGFCLRPGFGYPLDEWRIEQLWPLYAQGVHAIKEAQNWAEWWTLWRRVAGGLDAAAQDTIATDLAPYLEPPEQQQKIKGPKKQGYDDMVRLIAALEHLAPARKAEIGGWLLQRLSKKGESVQTWWALGRIGTRVPFHGSAHQVVDSETAGHWLSVLLQQDWRKVQPAAFAATMLARLSGDRSRDLPDDLRQRTIQRLRELKAPAQWITMISEVSELDDADTKRFFGEGLPTGLRLAD